MDFSSTTLDDVFSRKYPIGVLYDENTKEKIDKFIVVPKPLEGIGCSSYRYINPIEKLK